MAETIETSLVGEIDTSAPFESVREAATRFGGFGLWNPSSHNISENDVDEGDDTVVSELEKELICKEGETLKILKSLKSTKALVQELKSKLQRQQEDKENLDLNVLDSELNKAKMNLCKTNDDLAAIRESFELLKKRVEAERAKEMQRLSLVAARKMKEAARMAEAVAMADIKAVTSRKRRRNGEERVQEEILGRIKETGREMRSFRKTMEEGLEKAEQRTLYQNRGERVLMDVNGVSLMVNGDRTSSSVAVLKPTMSVGEILRRKLLLGDGEAMMMMNGRVSLGEILGMSSNSGNGERKEIMGRRFSGKRKRFGFGNLSVMLNNESKKKKKKKKMVLNLK